MLDTSTPFTLRANEDDVMDGINSILNMFETIRQPVFPRRIMTASYSGAFIVYDIKQMYNAFRRANFQDCRISAYPDSNNSVLIPNLLLLDIDYDNNSAKLNGVMYADTLNKTLVNKILQKLQLKFNIHNFMVMHTGNGRHILIPFLFDSTFESIRDFNVLLPNLISSNNRQSNNIIGEYFISFAKKYLSGDKADKSNFPKFSNIFLRVPGTLNMKMKYGSIEVVRTEYEWKYERNSLPNFGDLHQYTDLFFDFTHYLCLEVDKERQKTKRRSKSFKRKIGNKYKWIEILYNTAISDCRKRILWLILAPYAINIRQMTPQNAFVWIKQWANRCAKVYPFDSGFDIDKQIDYYIAVAEDNGHYPITFNRIRVNLEEWEMKDGKYLWDIIVRKMPGYIEETLHIPSI